MCVCVNHCYQLHNHYADIVRLNRKGSYMTIFGYSCYNIIPYTNIYIQSMEVILLIITTINNIILTH